MEQDKHLHAGELIIGQLQKMERSQKWLARRLGMQPSTLCKKLKKPYIDTDLLERISCMLEYDFFLDLSDTIQRKIKKQRKKIL
jgi:lambda repressor-like predicted transcriptional regulator